MQKIRFGIVALLILLCCSVTPARAEVSIGIGLPHVSIGINLPLYPELVPIPGYPVYYAPRLHANYFFYDGMYWVFADDYWYASYWYNGPWWIVEPTVVPVFILRIPVRYYRSPPVYFRGWRPDHPPRWGKHWGHDWERHRRGWDKWKRGSAPPRAPLPVYQRKYTGERYPREVERQQELRQRHYRYQPRDRAVRQQFPSQGAGRPSVPARQERPQEPRMRAPGQEDIRRPAPPRQGGPVDVRPQQPPQPSPQQRGPSYREPREQREMPGTLQRERQAPSPQGREYREQERGRSQEQRGRGQEREGHEQKQRYEEERGR